MLLNLNPIMSIIFNVPAAIAATVRAVLRRTRSLKLKYMFVQIVASRTVRRLSNFTSSGPEMFKYVSVAPYSPLALMPHTALRTTRARPVGSR
jgi:hypothetical protein